MEINFISVDVFWTEFNKKIMSRQQWPLHFRHVIVCGFNCRGMWKQTLITQLVGFRNQSPGYCEMCANIVEKFL